jgi:hypothetical protein
MSIISSNEKREQHKVAPKKKHLILFRTETAFPNTLKNQSFLPVSGT